MLETELLVGAFGWDRDEWVGGFYPEELPEDWRLGYYSNRLRALLVPASTWLDEEIDPAEWLDDLYPEFRMVLEWQLPDEGDAGEAVEDFLQRTSAIANNVDAYLVVATGALDETAVKAIERLQRDRPVSVVGKDLQPAPSGYAGIPGVSSCWLVDQQPEPAPSGSYLVALTGQQDLKAIRGIMETINTWPAETGKVDGAGLFFLDQKAAETAVQARTVAELLGV